MSINKIGRKESTAPCYGITPGFMTVGDFGNPMDTAPITALSAVAANTTSAAQTTNCRSIECDITTSVAGATFTLVVYRVDSGPTDTEVFRLVGATAGHVMVGGNEGVNLDGLQCKVRAESISSGNVTVKIKRGY